MSAKACTSGKTVLDLWKFADNTNRQLYSVARTVGTNPGIIGVSLCVWEVGASTHVGRRLATCPLLCVWLPPPQANVTIVDVGRSNEGCAAYLSVGTATVGQCQNTVSGLGSSTSPGGERSNRFMAPPRGSADNVPPVMRHPPYPFLKQCPHSPGRHV